MPGAAYIIAGELTVERKKDRKKQRFAGGEAVPETVDTLHTGVAGSEPAVLIVVYDAGHASHRVSLPLNRLSGGTKWLRIELQSALAKSSHGGVGMWPDNKILDLFGIEVPIIQSPMAGTAFSDMVVAVSEAGGLGSLACALLSVEQARNELEVIRRGTSRPINVNFLCHQQPRDDSAREMNWRRRLDAYYIELGLGNNTAIQSSNRAPFDEKMCGLVMEFHPEVVSFHFGLPNKNLLARVRRAGAKIISSATTVDEARWLENQGCDAIVAQGYEAGGHRGMFLTQDVSTQVGTMALVPQVADAVKVPVIAAGGVADARGIAAAFALGASAVQIGTAYLLCPDARISGIYRQALRDARENRTAVTNVFTGRSARGIVNRLVREVGPMSDLAPEFPLAAAALAPLRSKSELAGSADFSQLWSGQAARLNRGLPAAELTRQLAAETLEKLRLLWTMASEDVHSVLAKAAGLAKVGKSVSR